MQPNGKPASSVKQVPAASEIPHPSPQVDSHPYSSTPLPSDSLLGVVRPGFTSRKPSAPLPPPQVSTTSNPPRETAMDSQPYSSVPLPSDLLLGVTRSGLTSGKPSAPLAFGARFPSPIPMNAPQSKERLAASSVRPTEVPPEPSHPILDLELARSSWPTAEFLREDQVLSTSQRFVPSKQRRRHLRRETSSITYLELDDNGGILRNLGTGGLSLQAVAGLNPGQDLTLHFGLFDEEETITAAGRVVWVGPTRKVAGIRFENLSRRAEQSIARWIAREETGPDATEWKPASSVKPVPQASEIPFLPPQVSAASNPPRETAMDSRPYSSTPLPSDLLLGITRPGHTSGEPSAPLALGVRLPSPTPMNAVHPKEDSAASTVSPVEVPSEPLQPTPDRALASSSQPTMGFLSGDRMPPDSPRPFSLAGVTSGTEWISSIGDKWIRSMRMMLSSLQGKRRLQVEIVAVLAACLGIFVLILIAPSFGKHPENPGSSATSASAPLNSSQPQALPLLAAQSGSLNSSNPIPAPPQITQPTETSWLTTLKRALWGVDDRATLDPAIAGVTVWTDQRSGFYYCTSNPYFVKPLRVSMMTQEEALQSGFQPKIGSYCH